MTKRWVGIIREIKVRTVVVEAETMEEARYQLKDNLISVELSEVQVSESRKIVREFRSGSRSRSSGRESSEG